MNVCKTPQRIAVPPHSSKFLALALILLAGDFTGFADVPLVTEGQPKAVIVTSSQPGEFTRLGAVELQTYLHRLSGATVPQGNDLQISSRPVGESLVVAVTVDHPLARELAQAGQLNPADLKSEGFLLKTLVWKNRPAVVIAGADDAGVLYGVYELLERLGITFRLTGDILPSRTNSVRCPGLDLRLEPAFPRRGFLHTAVYDNVTMYDWPQYEQLLDEMARMKCNYVQFWWFAYTPWLKFAFRGEPKALGDVSAIASGYHTWALGGFGSRTIDDISVGREHFQDRPRMAPLAMQKILSPDQAFEISRDLLQRFIAHAARRNVKVWLVIELASVPPNLARHGEIVGDAPFHYIFGSFMHPLDPVNREIQASRLEAIQKTYPGIEGVFLNFAELYPELVNDKHREFFEQQRPRFQELRTLYLPWSGPLANFYDVNADKVIDSNLGYFDLFSWVLKKRDEVAPGLKLGLMTVGRGYALPLFHRLVPPDVPFASLESSGVWTMTGLPMEYFGGMAARERIVQPRVDDDFEMVGLQFNVRQFAEKDRVFIDGQKYGVTGVAGQVDRPRGTEFTSSFLAEATWDPALTPEQFYRRSAVRIFGTDAAEDMTRALLKLEENQVYLNYYEYEAGYGVLVCCSPIREVNAVYNYWRQKNPYAGPTARAWRSFIAQSSPFIAKREGSIRRLNEALAQFQAAAPKVAPHGRREWQYLVNRTETHRDLFLALNTYRRGLVNFDAAFRHKEKLTEADFVQQLESSLEALRQGTAQLTAATRKFSELIDHVSDLGMLYQLNARVILGTELSNQHIENVVNYHRGKPYLQSIAWERLFPRRPDKGVEE